MATFQSHPLPVRKDVQDFLIAAEKLLAPVLRDEELTPEECHLICEYLTAMCQDNHPWSNHFKSTVTGHASSAGVSTPALPFKET
jgi:hypothetical protein